MRWKFTHPGSWLSAISALLVIAFVYWDRGRVSPGDLSATHAQDPRLASGGCEQCHDGALGSMASACTRCHAEIAAQISGSKGFHGTMQAEEHDCAVCHSEHHGAGFPLSGARSFALAGFADRTLFDHRNLEYHLTGRHAALECSACHANADATVLAQGEKRFLGLTQRCTECHQDVHEGRLPDCAACHGEEHEFRRVANFAHGARFPLRGSHARPGCLDCHPKGSRHAVEAMAAKESIVETSAPAPRACLDCHPSPHAEAFVRAAGLKTGMTDGAACEACHLAEHSTFAASEAKMDRARHGLSGFTLESPHDKAQCADCHSPPDAAAVASAGATAPTSSDAFTAFRASHPGRNPDECRVCHGDPHGGQFAGLAGANCVACHDRHSFTPHTFGIEQHALTSFALTGSHAAVGCNECHKQTQPVSTRAASASKPPIPAFARVFHGTSSDCESCHRDAHDHWFDRANLDLVVDGEKGCARCHTTDVFAETRSPAFDHAKWTGFALVGAHARSECSSCHVPRAQADDTGRKFGKVGEHFRGSPNRCSTCHADAHRGFFDRPKIAANLAGGTGCAECHTQESFRDVAPGFDHGRSTGYALEGAHARGACTICHAETAAQDPNGRRFGFSKVGADAANADCRACHVDPHQGGFDRKSLPRLVDGRAGCLRCHTTESFGDASRAGFDHGQWTRFALDGAHASATCERCHAPRTGTDGRTKVFGKATGTDCAACHADPHVGQFARAGATECARCHTTESFGAGRFDHRKDSRFALDDTHKKLACSACHIPAPLPGGGTAIRYKPLGVTCGDCHDPRGGVRSARDALFAPDASQEKSRP